MPMPPQPTGPQPPQLTRRMQNRESEVDGQAGPAVQLPPQSNAQAPAARGLIGGAAPNIGNRMTPFRPWTPEQRQAYRQNLRVV